MSTASDATKTGKLRLGGSNLWLFLLLASMILFGVNTGVATWQGSRLADAGSKAADLQVLSQQLANQGRDAVGGNAQAFTAFKATRNARVAGGLEGGERLRVAAHRVTALVGQLL